MRRRAERLGEAALSVPMLAEPSLESVLAALEAERPAACVIDSVQTLAVPDTAPGSVGAVREATSALLETAKRLDVTLILIGHVTKEGSLAGPRALEHLVDCVLHFEGERERTFRTLRALKNRFGATSEVGVFEMRQGGLVEVADPSARFVGEARRPPGSVVLCAMEGTRPLLVEVQALVAPTEMVPPRRTATGVDRNRLALVLAVLTRHAGISLSAADVFVNVAGGIRVDEPGADLAIALAVASAHSGRALEADGKPLACFGEIGLTGEIRYVAHADRRVAEARKFGLGRVLGPPAGDEPIKGLNPVGDDLKAALSGGRGAAKLRASCVAAPRAGGAIGGAHHAITERRWEVPMATGPARRAPGQSQGDPPSGTALDKSFSDRSTRISPQSTLLRYLLPSSAMASSLPGDDLQELEARQDPRLLRALDIVAPGTALREGIDNIVHSRTGGLIVIGDPEEVSFLFSGGISLDIDYTPALLYQVAKMDGAIVLNEQATRIVCANVQLMPDPDDPLVGDGYPAPHRGARLEADRRPGRGDLRAAGRRLALPGRDEVHPPGHPSRPREGQPGPRHPRQVPRPPRLRLDSPHAASSSRARPSSTRCSPCFSAPSS